MEPESATPKRRAKHLFAYGAGTTLQHGYANRPWIRELVM
jgi:hypothetical protein